ncbi:MAG TPA: hypothetical protein DCY20_09160 [Firmicutes bacterium]|nr:hypothetical protein [Bacillota bacterium]
MSLKCSVRSCCHNDDSGKCYASVVQIRGAQSLCTDETLCKSFHSQTSCRPCDDTEFGCEFNAAKLAADVKNIKCSAAHCKHNVSNRCSATHVQVNRETASCETFEM